MAQRAATIAEVRLRLGPATTWVDPPITDALIQMYLDDTACFVAPATWGDCASIAHAYAAAHAVACSPEGLTILGQGNPALGQLAGEANGPSSRSFAVTAAPFSEAWWSGSKWGRTFLEYRRKRWGRGSAVLARTSRTARRAC